MIATAADWRVAITHPAEPTPTCAPTLLSHRPDSSVEYVGGCRGCEWISSEPTVDANQAVEAAHDHTHHGYRDLPAIELPTGWRQHPTAKRLDAVRHSLAIAYPAGWIEAGHAPMWTYRNAPADRHVPGGSLFGGYDLASHSHRQTSDQRVRLGDQGVLFS